MSTDWLTVNLVEDIQHALLRGIRVDSIISGLSGGTLPALMEYGCLRWHERSRGLPALPASIRDSELGKALLEATANEGTTATADDFASPCGLAVRSAEFATLANVSQLHQNAWELFEARFNRSAQNAGFARSVAGQLQAAFREMVDNALLHAKPPVPVKVGYRILPSTAQFCVVDVGIGVLASLKSCADYENLRSHKEAIRLALQDGVSCCGRGKGGLGFREVFKALALQWGILRFRSGEGCITIDGTEIDADKGCEHFPPFLPGFQVTVTCRSKGGSAGQPLV